MAPHDPLQLLRRRANRYALEDGLADVIVGIYTITVGVATQRRAHLALAVAYLLLYTITWRILHDRFVGRRAGYAEPEGQPTRVLLTGSLAAVTLTLVVVGAITLSAGTPWSLASWPDWSAVLAGVILAAGLIHTAMRAGLGRYYAYAGLSIAGSVFFWLFPFGLSINPSDRLTLFLFALGAVVFLVGLVVMIRFRRTHPLVTLEGHDGH